MFGTVRTEVHRRYLSGKYPTEVFGKVRYSRQYSTEHSDMVRFGLDTVTRRFGELGTPTKISPGTGLPYLNTPFGLLPTNAQLTATHIHHRQLPHLFRRRTFCKR